MSISKLKVRYAETDCMGVVHHSNYYVYFEAAREDLIQEIGMTYKELEDLGIMMPLVETHCRYIEAAKYADILIIETKVEELSQVKLKLGYEVRRESDNKIIAKGYTLQTFVDKENFKIVNLKTQRPELWACLNKIK